MKENSSNVVKETDVQIQEAQRVPNKMDAKRPSPRHFIIKMPMVKDKERILKAARKKKLSFLQGSSHKTLLISQKKLCRQEGIGKTYSKF